MGPDDQWQVGRVTLRYGQGRRAVVAGVCAVAVLVGCSPSRGGSGKTTMASTSSPSTSAPLVSEAASPTVVSVVPPATTSVPKPQGALSDWPAPTGDAIGLEDVPYFLPSVEIEARSIELSTIELSAGEPGLPAFVQEYAGGASGVFVWVETTVGRSSPVPSDAEPFSLGAWTSAYLIDIPAGSTVVLSDASGEVTVSVVGADETAEAAMLFASSLARRPLGEPGWILQPGTNASDEDRSTLADVTPVSEGWNVGLKQRTTRWLGADAGPVVEVLIAVGRPQLAFAQLASVPSLLDGFVGGQAIGQVIPDKGSLVAWSPSQAVTITVVTRGPVAETLRVAESMTVVSERDWESSGVLLPPRVEVGCEYFFSDC